jgi:hypothetical protein
LGRTALLRGAATPLKRALKQCLRKHEEELLAAMHADMRKPRFEAYMSERRRWCMPPSTMPSCTLKDWMRPQRAPSPCGHSW